MANKKYNYTLEINNHGLAYCDNTDYLEREETYEEMMHRNILEDMHKLYIDKNRDYGNSVHDTYEKYGMVSFLVRIEDKINRIKKLTDKNYNQRVMDEKVEDTLKDLANYAVLALMEYKIESNKEVACEEDVI